MNTTEFTLADLLELIRSKLRLIIIIGVLCAFVTFGCVKFFVAPSYTCTGTVLINPIAGSEEYNSSVISSEINISMRLIPTYLEILTSNDFSTHISQMVNESNNVDILPETVHSMTAYTNDSDSLIFKYTCSSNDAEMVKMVADAISKHAPDYVRSIIDHGEIIVIDSIGSPVKHTTSPYLMAMVAFVAAAVMVVVITMLINSLDTRLKSVEDIYDNFDYPVLGKIPDFNAKSYDYEYKSQ